MNLKDLSLAECKELTKSLGWVISAAETLGAGGLEPVISLTETATTLRAPSILGGSRDDGGLVEPVELVAPAAQVDPYQLHRASPLKGIALRVTGLGDPAAPAADNTPTAQVSVSKDFAAAVAAPAPVPTRAKPAKSRASGELRTGPFGDSERETLLTLHETGMSSAEIAGALGRHAGPVSMMLRQLLAKRQSSEGGDTEPAAPVPSPGAEGMAADAAAAPSGPALGIGLAGAAPGGDDLTNDDNSGVAEAPQSVPADAGPRMAAASGAPTPPPAAVPAPAVVDGPPPPAVPPQGAASSTVPPAAPPVQQILTPATPRLACPEGLSTLEKQVWFSVAGLKSNASFDPDLDFDLVDGLARGRKLAELALELDVDAAAAKARFALLNDVTLNDRGRITLDGQAALLKVLKLRMVQARGAKA